MTKVEKLMTDGPLLIDCPDVILAERVSKIFNLAYWDEINHPDGVFSRQKDDDLDHELRYSFLFCMIDLMVKKGADFDKAQGLKKIIMICGCKPGIHDDQYRLICNDPRYLSGKTDQFNAIIDPAEGQSIEEAGFLSWWAGP